MTVRQVRAVDESKDGFGWGWALVVYVYTLAAAAAIGAALDRWQP